MTDTSGKARVHAALDGRRVDRFPVTALYSNYYQADHFAEQGLARVTEKK